MRHLAIVVLCLAPAAWAAGGDLADAEKLYSYTDYDGSLKLLGNREPKTSEVYHLMGKNYFMMGDYKRATDFLEKAVSAEPANSVYVHWLGRAYGRRAETSSLFTAPKYAVRARENFERAVELDPKNLEAINDLFEYYLEAPGIMGGGFDKAKAVAARIARLDPVEGHYAQARLAEKRQEYGSAEQQLRRAAEMAPQQVGRLIDLAKFLAKQGKFQESEQSFEEAARVAPGSPKLLFARADTYIQTGRNLNVARQLLQQYLQAKLTPDDPPRSDAQKLLKQASGS